MTFIALLPPKFERKPFHIGLWYKDCLNIPDIFRKNQSDLSRGQNETWKLKKMHVILHMRNVIAVSTKMTLPSIMQTWHIVTCMERSLFTHKKGSQRSAGRRGKIMKYEYINSIIFIDKNHAGIISLYSINVFALNQVIFAGWW